MSKNRRTDQGDRNLRGVRYSFVERFLIYISLIIFIAILIISYPKTLLRTAHGEPMYSLLSGDVYVVPYLSQKTILSGCSTNTSVDQNIEFEFREPGCYTISFANAIGTDLSKISFVRNVVVVPDVYLVSNNAIGFVCIHAKKGFLDDCVIFDVRSAPGR